MSSVIFNGAFFVDISDLIGLSFGKLREKTQC